MQPLLSVSKIASAGVPNNDPRDEITEEDEAGDALAILVQSRRHGERLSALFARSCKARAAFLADGSPTSCAGIRLRATP